MSDGMQRTGGGECKEREDQDKEWVEATHSWRQRLGERGRRCVKEKSETGGSPAGVRWSVVVYKAQGFIERGS